MLRFPFNLLIFSKELELSEEDFKKKLVEQIATKKESTFQLDVSRISSATQLKEKISGKEIFRFYNDSAIEQGLVYAGTQFVSGKNTAPAFICINLQNPKECTAFVYGSSKNYNDSVLKDLLDIMAP